MTILPRRGFMVASALLLGALQAKAQTRAVVVDAGPGAPGRILRAALADPATRVLVGTGDSTGRLVSDREGTTVVFSPKVIVASRVRGTIIVVGGDLFVHPGATIEGKAIAIGGAVYPSKLAAISGGPASYRDVTFDTLRVGSTLELRYRELSVVPPPAFALPGIQGIGFPAYDRTNGVSLPLGPSIVVPGTSIDLRPGVTYRSQLGVWDPSMSIEGQLTRRTRFEATAGRGTFTNERWVLGDFMSSLVALTLGKDPHNWFRADRAELTLHRIWEGSTSMLEPYVGGRIERSWSVRPGATPTSGPWSVFGRRDSLGMWRPNPAVEGGSIGSVLAGIHADGDVDAIQSALDVDFEAPVSTTVGASFVQTTLDGRVEFPTFGTQRFRTELHLITTVGDRAPRQRWSYLGGTGTVGTMELLEQGGDNLFFLDNRYEIPLDSLILPVVGAPKITIRHMLAGAAANRFPTLAQVIGVRVSAAVFRAELLMDTKERKPELKFSLALTR